jgi:hypothetical protein
MITRRICTVDYHAGDQRLWPANSRAELKLLMDYAPEGGSEALDPYYRDTAAFGKVLDLTAAASRGLIARCDRAYRIVRSSQ